jgi:hypothetical protein
MIGKRRKLYLAGIEDEHRWRGGPASPALKDRACAGKTAIKSIPGVYTARKKC